MKNKNILVFCAALTFALSACGGQGGGSAEKKITFKKESETIELFDTSHIFYTLEGFDEGVVPTWTSSNSEIASVDQNGNVYGENLGEATITATIDKTSASMKFTVALGDEISRFTAIDEVAVYKDEIVAFNEKTTFKGKEVYATYTYDSSNPEIVEIKNGKPVAKAEGTCNVTITSDYKGMKETKTAKVNVIPCIEIALERENYVIASPEYLGKAFVKEVQLSPKAYVNGEIYSADFLYSVDNITIASITNGLVKGIKEGETTINCKFTYSGKEYEKHVALSVVYPNSHIEEKLLCNMLDVDKKLDLGSVGIDVNQVSSIKVINESSEQPINFVVSDKYIVIQIDDSYKGSTKRLRLIVSDESYTIDVEFKDYIPNKIAYGDAESHLTDFSSPSGMTLTYDATKSVPESALRNSDKELFSHEKSGTLQCKLTGKNEESLVLNNPQMRDISKYTMIIFYIYTEVPYYICSTDGTGGTELVANQWNRISFNDLSKVYDTKGNSVSDNNGYLDDLVIKFTNYEETARRQFIWISSMFVDIAPVNKLINMGKGLLTTTWWINGVHIYSGKGYDDYYAHESKTMDININDIEEQDKSFIKFEDKCCEITYDGTSDSIDAFYFGAASYAPYTHLVFYVLAPSANAAQMSISINKRADDTTIVSSLKPNQWTRVDIDVINDRLLDQSGKLMAQTDALNGFYFSINVHGLSPDESKFYFSSIFGC